MGVMVVTKTMPGPKHLPAERADMTGSIPLPYRGEELNEDPTLYKDQVRGVVPGYGGHVPRAHHVYGESAVGKIEKDKTHHDRVSQARHPNTKQAIVKEPPAYNQMVGGIVPGYAGYVPQSSFICGKTHMGQSKPFLDGKSPIRQGRSGSNDEFLDRLRVAEISDTASMGGGKGTDQNELQVENNWWPSGPSAPEQRSYRSGVGGVIPGYGGHVPRSQYKYGDTAVGKVKAGNQAGFEDTKASPPFDVHERIDEGHIMPGYSGYVPGSREKVGGSFYWTEDSRKFAGKMAGESTEDNDRQTAKSMGDLFSEGAVGFDESGNPLDT